MGVAHVSFCNDIRYSLQIFWLRILKEMMRSESAMLGVPISIDNHFKFTSKMHVNVGTYVEMQHVQPNKNPES